VQHCGSARGVGEASARQLLGVTAEQTQNVHIQMPPQQTDRVRCTHSCLQTLHMLVVVLLLPHPLPLPTTPYIAIFGWVHHHQPTPFSFSCVLAGAYRQAAPIRINSIRAGRQSVNLLVHQQSSFSLSGLCWATTTTRTVLYVVQCACKLCVSSCVV
jgi:hypothetical protein